MYGRVVMLMLTDVSDIHTASIITHRPDDINCSLNKGTDSLYMAIRLVD
jgi:hypothetical protein